MNSDRYQRHSLIDWFSQETLSASSVVVVGAGAIGNEVIKNLCLLGVGRIHIIDYDTIEESNLTRTILFRSGDIGASKAEAAAAACQKIDPNVNVTFSHSDFWETLSIESLKGYDAVICCVDNLEARIRLNSMCLIAHTDLLNGGIDSRNVSVELYPFRTDLDCACFECWLPPSAYSTVRQRYSCGWLKKVALRERKVPTTTVTASIAGASLTSLFLQRRCEHPNSLPGSRKCTIDTITLASSISGIGRYDQCPGCSRMGVGSHLYRTKRSSTGKDLTGLLADKSFTIFLSEPVVLHTVCNECGEKNTLLDCAAKFDERLAECNSCRKRTNVVTIVESLPYEEAVTLFSEKPIPVKFLYFLRDEQQFILELHDEQ